LKYADKAVVGNNKGGFMDHISYIVITSLSLSLIGCIISIVVFSNKNKKLEKQIDDVIKDRTKIKTQAADYIWASFNQPEKEPSIRNQLIPMVFNKNNADIVKEKCSRVQQRKENAKFKKDIRDVTNYRSSDPSKYLPKANDRVQLSAKIKSYDKTTKTAELINVKEFEMGACFCEVEKSAEQDVIVGFIEQCDVLLLCDWLFKTNQIVIKMVTPIT
jgi:hypothetical protein